MLRSILILAALALPARGAEPLLKWIEPARIVRHHGIEDWWPERYLVFETYWDSDLCCYRYQQRMVSPWEWASIEIPPHVEGDEEP